MMYRQLTMQEVARLTAQGCRCDNWQDIEVAHDFAPDYLSDACFVGKVRMEAFDAMADLGGGVFVHAGIHRAVVADCRIGRNACIVGVRRFLSHCRVGDEAVIADVGAVYATRGQAEIGRKARVVQCGSLCNVCIADGVCLENIPVLSDVSLSRFPTEPESGRQPEAVRLDEAPPAWETMPDSDDESFAAQGEELLQAGAGPSFVPPAPEPAPAEASVTSVMSRQDNDIQLASTDSMADEPPTPAAPADEQTIVASGTIPPQPRQASLFDALDEMSHAAPADTLQKGYSPINEKFTTGIPLADALQDRSLTRLEDGIGLNDRFLFTRELFKSNPHLYKECIKKVDACAGREEALAYIAATFNWSPASATAGKFLNLVHRRFPVA